MRIRAVLLASMVLFFASPALSAETWVSLERLSINKVQAAPGAEVVWYREMLPGAKLLISGRFTTPAGMIKEAALSTDAGQTWVPLRLSGKGSFEYSFKTSAGAVYDLVLRTVDKKDTPISDGGVRVTIPGITIYQAVNEAIDGLISAYQDKNMARFNDYVSESLTDDDVLLDRGVRNDFHTVHDMDIRYTLNGIVPDYKNKVFAAITFNRRYTHIKTGKTVNDSGQTSLIFIIENGKMRLHSTRGTPLFGFSS